jgi:pyruvate dehydrogenase (quinone)
LRRAADVAEIARRIDEAGSIVVMYGAGCQGAEELRAISDRLKAPLIHSVRGKTLCLTTTGGGWAVLA